MLLSGTKWYQVVPRGTTWYHGSMLRYSTVNQLSFIYPNPKSHRFTGETEETILSCILWWLSTKSKYLIFRPLNILFYCWLHLVDKYSLQTKISKNKGSIRYQIRSLSVYGKTIFSIILRFVVLNKINLFK